MFEKESFKPEVLAPAGDEEALSAAVRFGADAVFLAGKQFGMRTASKNFDEAALERAVALCHNNGVKLYLTCNTLPRSDELERLPDFLSFAQDCGVDALIIADLGVMRLAQKYAPKLHRHISTQAGIVNYESARFFYEQGASRVVLARELSLEEIALIRAKTPPELEIECFVQGAMCVSFSGRCLISNYLAGRDANRGDCCQPCRWEYHLYEQSREGQFFPVVQNDEGTFLYNSRDLCMIKHIPQLVSAGVSSLKIEGRAKSAYYTAVTANAYRKAVDAYAQNREKEFTLPEWIAEELEKISHREYSTGFYFGGEPGQNTQSGGYIRKYAVVAICERELEGASLISQRNRFFKGDELDILPPDGISFTASVLSLETEDGIPVESAPHPMQRLILTSDKKIPAGSYLRKRLAE